jgi:hypothetical protein
VRIRIEGTDLPGRRFGTDYDNVHVGVQCRREVVDLVPGDAPTATWTFDVAAKPDADVGGPYVHGPHGGRFLYLSWGTVDDKAGFAMFRRAKIHFEDVPADLLAAAAAGSGVLVGRIRLTDGCGAPLCARVRPPFIGWHLAAGR